MKLTTVSQPLLLYVSKKLAWKIWIHFCYDDFYIALSSFCPIRVFGFVLFSFS